MLWLIAAAFEAAKLHLTIRARNCRACNCVPATLAIALDVSLLIDLLSEINFPKACHYRRGCRSAQSPEEAKPAAQPMPATAAT